uniref:hypothetical protein n=1 Tax=Sphingomonas populi TaxID=2484750 RepID=UPI0013EE5986
MSDTDLMRLAQFLLPGIAIRYPDVGLMIAEHLLGDAAGSATLLRIRRRTGNRRKFLPLARSA